MPNSLQLQLEHQKISEHNSHKNSICSGQQYIGNKGQFEQCENKHKCKKYSKFIEISKTNVSVYSSKVVRFFYVSTFRKCELYKLYIMTKIDDQVYQFPMTFSKGSDMILEFFVCKTNELNPHREIKELGVVLYEKDEEARKSSQFRQLDNSNEMGVKEIEELIKYLQKVKKHIKTFNENSKPDNV